MPDFWGDVMVGQAVVTSYRDMHGTLRHGKRRLLRWQDERIAPDRRLATEHKTQAAMSDGEWVEMVGIKAVLSWIAGKG